MYNILLAEDGLITYRELNTLVDWENLGFALADFCRDGLSAQRRLQKKAYDLLLCDTHLPALSGLELAEWTHKACPETEIILTSEHARFEYARRAIDCGAAGYLLRPVRPSQLTEALLRARQRLDLRSRTSQQDMDLVARAVVEINNDCGKGLTVEQLARRLFVSPTRLNDQFRRRFGVSIRECIHSTRMEHAEYLLTHTQKKIYEIANECGFQDIDYFSQLFRQHTGKSPSEYRGRAVSASTPTGE